MQAAVRTRHGGEGAGASAADHRQTLTPDDVAVSRARDAAIRIDSYLKAMMANGALREFNRAFKRRRMEATANGQGFMSSRRQRLDCGRRSFRLLVNGRTVGPVQTLFAEFLIGDLSAAYFSGAARDQEHLTSCRAPSPASVRRQHQREFS
jgi:hypothetical protein